MKDEYQKELNQIHAPKELIEQTKVAMRKETMRKEAANEQRKIKITITLKRSALASAAIILIAVGGYGYYSTQNQLNVVAVSSTSFSLDPNFGKVSDGQAKGPDNKLKITSASKAEVIPDFLKEVKPSKVKGVSVQLGIDDQGVYHAAYQEDDTYYYVIGEDLSEKEFIESLKKKL